MPTPQTITELASPPRTEAHEQPGGPLDFAPVISTIDALANGQFSMEVDISGVFEGPLRNLSDKLQSNAHQSIASTTDLTMSTVDTMTTVAEMAGDLKILNGNTQTIASVVKDLSLSSDNLARNAGDAAKDADAVKNTAAAGSEDVEQAITVIKQVNDVVEAMASRLAVLEQAATQITDMVDSIEKISSQTKLLALNASVEAARAGDSGRGFGVVALEVKSLSEQTSTTTDQMRSRIGTLNSEMAAISKAMEESIRTVSTGHQMITNVGQRINEISTQTTTIANHMAEIAEVINHQRLSTSRISGDIDGIAHSSNKVHQNAESIIKIGSKTTELIDQQFLSFEGMELSTYVLQRAKVDHLLWKRNIAEMFAGFRQIDPSSLSSHHTCRLGKWYHNLIDPHLIRNASYQAIAKPHERVHSMGRAAAVAYNEGDRVNALKHYKGMVLASVEVLRLLDDLIRVTLNEGL